MTKTGKTQRAIGRKEARGTLDLTLAATQHEQGARAVLAFIGNADAPGFLQDTIFDAIVKAGVKVGVEVPNYTEPRRRTDEDARRSVLRGGLESRTVSRSTPRRVRPKPSRITSRGKWRAGKRGARNPSKKFTRRAWHQLSQRRDGEGANLPGEDADAAQAPRLPESRGHTTLALCLIR
jgi:hypothetical protein